MWHRKHPFPFLCSDTFGAYLQALNISLVLFSAKVVYWHIEKQFAINQTVHYSHLLYLGAPHRYLLEMVATFHDQDPCPRVGV